ncbi:MAG: aldo/keto reductase [Phycisphaerae bacterium]
MPSANASQYTPAEDRYAARHDGWFRRCGRSGLLLPAVSLGCWHNFGAPGTDSVKHADEAGMHENCRRMLHTAFDLGVTHFDLANNYGPPPGSAEERVGRILRSDFAEHRDELIISTKAGHRMWPGPYGEHGSRKHLLASLDQSLKRLGLDYVDIYYHHRPDPVTPLEETLGALDHAVKTGRAVYAGVSNYQPDRTRHAVDAAARHQFAKPVIHQPSYNILNRWIENGLLDACGETGMGLITFSPLAQGLLTDKYLQAVPEDSRAAGGGFLKAERITPELRTQLNKLNDIAQARGQSLAQMALQWTLRDARVTSTLIGASRPEQIVDGCQALNAAPLTAEELAAIDAAVEAPGQKR